MAARIGSRAQPSLSRVHGHIAARVQGAGGRLAHPLARHSTGQSWRRACSFSLSSGETATGWPTA